MPASEMLFGFFWVHQNLKAALEIKSGNNKFNTHVVPPPLCGVSFKHLIFVFRKCIRLVSNERERYWHPVFKY